MLGERIEINIKIQDRDIPLKLNVRSLKNLGELTRLNPFKYLYDFIHTKDEEDKNQMLVNILLAFTDANLTVEDLPKILDQNQQMDYLISLLMINEIMCEIEEDKKSDSNEIEEEEEEDEYKGYKNWCDVYNYYYYVATVQLHMSKEQFLDTTLRELKTLDKLNKDYLKNIIINYYIDVNTARNNSGKKEVETLKATKQNKVRIKNLLIK